MQLKAGLGDLVRKYGLHEVVISVPGAVWPNGSVVREGSATSGNSKPSPSQLTSSLTTPHLLPVPGPPSPSQFLSIFSKSSKPKLGSMIPMPYPPPNALPQVDITPLPFSKISVSLAPRTIDLVVGSSVNKCTLVQVQRCGRDEKLEIGTRLLINELKDYLPAKAHEP